MVCQEGLGDYGNLVISASYTNREHSDALDACEIASLIALMNLWYNEEETGDWKAECMHYIVVEEGDRYLVSKWA
jgi:hypothetical protein